MRISFKLLGISEAVLLVAVFALVIPALAKMKMQIVDQMQKELRAIAANAAPLIDGDLHRDVQADGVIGRAFPQLKAVLRDIMVRNDLDHEHIYTFYRDGDTVRFAVMVHPTPFFGDAYTLQPGMLDVFENGDVHVTDLYDDEHGRWISAYAPIRDKAGAIVGLLEVDRPAADYFERLERLVVAWLAPVGLLALAISSALGWRVLNMLVIRPVREIRDGVAALGAQDFTHRVELTTRDEFQDLGNALNDISKQLNAAKLIQSSFFPKRMPQQPGTRVAGLSMPCDAAGGDYFDALDLGDGRLAILLGDVSGHGLGPALLMASARSAVHALSSMHLDPAALVDRLNTLLLEDLSQGRFITFIYGVLEPDGTFTYANAGHGPAFVASGGRVTHLDSHRPPLGIVVPRSDEAQQSTVNLTAGDRVLLASDGLSEAMDARGRMYGNEPIERAVGDASLDADGVVARLRTELLEHCGGPSGTDDVTILCVDRL